MSNSFSPSPLEILPNSRCAPISASPDNSPVSALDDWQLVVLLLPSIDSFDDYLPREICAAIGLVSVDTLTDWAKQIWPDHIGRWRFCREDAHRLIRKYMRHGQRRHSRETLEYLVERKRAQRIQNQRVLRELSLQTV